MSRVRPERRGYAKANYEQHIERIKSMKATIDCGPPRAHPFTNKREQDKKREFALIEFDNKLLLERLAKVVQQKTIDNEVDKEIEFHAVFKKKLGLTRKRIEMQKLTEENQRLLKRIQEVPSAYNRFEWEEDAKRNDVIKRCMALYPEFYEKQDKEKAIRRQLRAAGGSSVGSYDAQDQLMSPAKSIASKAGFLPAISPSPNKRSTGSH